jgi:hypothetical protein
MGVVISGKYNVNWFDAAVDADTGTTSMVKAKQKMTNREITDFGNLLMTFLLSP